MYSSVQALMESPVRVGLIGTGYAAKLRAEALQKDDRAHLVAVSDRRQDKTEAFAKDFECNAISQPKELVKREDIDLVVISNVNSEHGTLVGAALAHGKHVVVEYPLCLDVGEAEELIALAKIQKKLLHVEHLELLGGLHNCLKEYLPQMGEVFYARYSTINPQNPSPRKWTYNHELFGFPLMGALSRLHRLIDLFGEVLTINCHNRFWQTEADFYQTCFLSSQVNFTSGLLAQLVYGKGETIWQPERKFEIHGEHFGIVIDGDKGILIKKDETIPIELPPRKGLFAKDTQMVLDHLFQGTPLYVTPQQSLYTLKVADAARRSASMGITIVVDG
ncbi:MAG: Gfo/Idh/MocA family oxidoreductase [Scytonematopsis contorta HA4267-MV1]|jgi:biliverdin reductase|nr:Gfo/Idh/MocA family oxidoreductase [Scytonematopsis contorta HA4267-MV1]